ncbi:hypothetical protein ACGYK5_15680 [Sulfitobacter sp. 1A16787]|uniref:hypothetical protein n=1 Tax=Sulfitobacter sp. 1A16787 TaxID=3368571 RepID=UPI0037472B5A
MATASLTVGNIHLTEQGVDKFSKRLRWFAYFWAFVSFVVAVRWLKISRQDIYMFDVAGEGNIWTWMNVTYMVLAAGALYLAALVRKQNGVQYRAWFVTAVGVLLLSLDDMVGIHERLEGLGHNMGGGDGFLHFAWVIPGMIVGALLIGVFGLAIRSADAPVRRDFILGIVFFFGGALVLEMMTGAVLSGYGHYKPYTALYHIEEFCEAVGVIFILSAALKDVICQSSRKPLAKAMSAPY